MCEVATSLALQEQHQALEYLNNGCFKDAEPLLTSVVAQLPAQSDAQTYMWKRRTAECLVGLGKFAEAEKLAKVANHGFERKYSKQDEDALDCKFLMAECLYKQKKGQVAVPICEAAIPSMEANLRRGPDHLTTLKCKALFAVIKKDMGNPAEAKVLAEATQERLDAVVEKAQIIAAQGGRKLTVHEQRSAQQVKDFLGVVFRSFNKGKESDDVRNSSKQTASTGIPDSELGSRRPSLQ